MILTVKTYMSKLDDNNLSECGCVLLNTVCKMHVSLKIKVDSVFKMIRLKKKVYITIKLLITSLI